MGISFPGYLPKTSSHSATDATKTIKPKMLKSPVFYISPPLGSGPGGVGGLRVGWGAVDLGPSELDRTACRTRSITDGACAGLLSRGASRQSGVADPGVGRDAAAGNLWSV